MSVRVQRLGRRGRFGSSWAEFLRWAGERVDPTADPWLLYPFGSGGPVALPALSGPVVYATVAVDGTCRYVGKSLAVRHRFSGHAGVPGRRQRWAYVAVCPLTGLPEGGLDTCEHVAAKILLPVEGSRHPRRRWAGTVGPSEAQAGTDDLLVAPPPQRGQVAADFTCMQPG